MNEMQKRLAAMPDLGYEDEIENEEDKVKVAKVTMAFANSEMIYHLTQRGSAIKAEQWDKQLEWETKINDLKQEKFELLTTPCSVFMTFETEEGISRALKYEDAIEADSNLDWCKTWLG